MENYQINWRYCGLFRRLVGYEMTKPSGDFDRKLKRSEELYYVSGYRFILQYGVKKCYNLRIYYRGGGKLQAWRYRRAHRQ